MKKDQIRKINFTFAGIRVKREYFLTGMTLFMESNPLYVSYQYEIP